MKKLNKIFIPNLSNYWFLIEPILNLIKAKRIVYIGAIRGEMTLVEKLLYWVESHEGELIFFHLHSIGEELKKIINFSSPHFRAICRVSHQEILALEAADLYIIDGDHNYYTVYQELKTSWELNDKATKPYFAIIRGTSWPFGRRDAYHDPLQIPSPFLHPHTWTQGIPFPEGEKNFRLDTMAFACEEGGKCNGVLTALLDFCKDKPVKLESLNLGFGLSFVFSKNLICEKEILNFLIKNKEFFLFDQMEEERILLLKELSAYSKSVSEENIKKQNKEFDTPHFCQWINQGKGKKEGLGKVSIIIPTFNRPELLKEAIQGTLDQTYKDLEIIVINDGGEDVSSLINAFSDKRILYVKHDVSLGASAARNSGLKKAQGKYIAYLDDDDLYCPSHVEILINALTLSGFSIVYADFFRVFKKKENHNWITQLRLLEPSIDVDKESILIDTLPINTVMHEQSCLNHIGLFDESLSMYEEWDLWIRLAQKYSFLHIPLPTSEYRKREGFSQIIAKWSGHFLKCLLIIHHRYSFLVKDKPGLQLEQKYFRQILQNNALKGTPSKGTPSP